MKKITVINKTNRHQTKKKGGGSSIATRDAAPYIRLSTSPGLIELLHRQSTSPGLRLFSEYRSSLLSELLSTIYHELQFSTFLSCFLTLTTILQSAYIVKLTDGL